jgi:predicted NBD/HSP70 family sugar kinase
MSVSGLAPFDRRGHQRRVIIDMLRRVRMAARTEIAAGTGLSPQVVTSLVDGLLREGLIREVGRRPSARGQPPVDLALNLEGGFAVGVQVEAGRLTGILCDLGANIRAKRTLACPTDDPNSAFESMRRLIAILTREARIDAARLWGVGIVLPGPFGTVEETERDPLTMPTWSRVPFRERFAGALSLPVFVGNDATAAAIGEHLNGVARELRTFFYLYVSEGVGGGLFVDGQPVMGAFGNAGEIGRMHFGLSAAGEVPQRLEAIASVDALRHRRGAAGTPDAATLDHHSLFDIDDEILDRWLTSAAQCLRVAVANIENLVDPEAVVIGGQVPERQLREIVARMEPLLPSVSQRGDRHLERILIGSAGRISAALGGATLPLFSRLTTQPRAIKPSPRGRSRASRVPKPGETPAAHFVGGGPSYE